MRIALAQVNTTVGDFPGNLNKVEEALDEGRQAGVDLVVFPEQTIPGYPAEDLLEREDFFRATEETFQAAVQASRGIGMVIGTLTKSSESGGNRVYNSACLVQDGRVLGVHHKALLPTYDVFDEARYFRPGGTHEVYDFQGRRLGLAICEDLWNNPLFWPKPRYETDPVKELIDCGADVIVGIAASPYSLGREGFRYRMMKSTVSRFGVPVVYVNLVGGNTTLVFDGASFALDSQGALLASAPSFAEAYRVFDLNGQTSDAVPEVFTSSDELGHSPVVLESAYRALVLGTCDYMEKSGFKRAVVGLSGGIDSALTAAIAVDAVGADKVIGVSMPSRYSSEGSLTDARELAENLGIEYHVISIENIFQTALETLSSIFSGREADVTEENLQARARGLLLMAISNKFGALLLTTGNKSELAVGYCTLYGDMSGGLAVISDVPKTLVYRISRWVNREKEIIPASTIEKPPSAELRPDQKDEDSLPSYEVLDEILAAYIEEGASLEEIESRGMDRETVLEVLRLVDRNEYKRKQAAPGLRITSKAFGPGRRIPIVQRFRRV